MPDQSLPPVVPRVTSNCALVQWEAPFDGNSPITGYTLECKKSGEKDWSSVATDIKEKITVVEDLEPYTSYRFRIIASNEIGNSKPSKPTNFIETDKSGKCQFSDLTRHLTILLNEAARPTLELITMIICGSYSAVS